MLFNCFTAMIDQKYGVSVYNFDSQEHRVQFEKESLEWCVKTFGYPSVSRPHTTWKLSFNTFYFVTEQQRTWFLLQDWD